MTRTKPSQPNLFFNYSIPLLLFLIGMTNVKLYVKIAAAIFYVTYCVFSRYKFPRKLIGLTPFYVFITLIGIVGALCNNSFAYNGYWLGAVIGALQWLLAGCSFYLLYVTYLSERIGKIKGTISLFFIINFIISLVQIGLIINKAHNWMPYWFDEPSSKYGPSTGDYILGVFGNNSATNASISVLACIYFMYERKIVLSFITLTTMLLCTSNVTVFCFIIILGLVFVFAKKQRLFSFLLIVYAITAYFFLSPMNVVYVKNKFFALNEQYDKEKKASELDSQVRNEGNQIAVREEYHKQKEEYRISHQQNKGTGNAELLVLQQEKKWHPYKVEVNDSIYHEYKNELLWLKKAPKDPTVTSFLNPYIVNSAIIKWYGMLPEDLPIDSLRTPGKLYSFRQTRAFLFSSGLHFLFGAGTGNFSSTLALKMTGIGLQGQFPEKYIYISRNFFEYHFYTTLYNLGRPPGEHSIINKPDSVYNQIAGEYGFIGIILFCVLYLGYFWRNRKVLSYGKYLVVAVLLFLGYNYWFEMLSLTVIFELLILDNIFTNKQKNGAFATTDNRTDAGI